MALAPDLETGNIHVYAHSRHNHPFMAAERRSICKNGRDLMPDANPPKIFRTPDSMEWTFLQTFSNFKQMDKFRSKMKSSAYRCDDNDKWLRIRFYCNLRAYYKCKFMLLALKTTKSRYHVYNNVKHTHPAVIKPGNSKRQQQSAKSKPIQQIEDEDDDEEIESVEVEKRQQEEPMEVEEADDGEEGDEEEEQLDDDDENIEEVEKIPIENDDDGIIVLEDEEQQQEEEEEEQGEIEIIEENALATPREETLKEKLAKANEKVYKWMAGIGPNEIEGTIGDWDKLSLLKMVEMADQEIQEYPQKFKLWLPWMKCAIPKCLPQIQGFNVRFKDLIKLTFTINN